MGDLSTLAFSLAEYRGRLQRVQAAMRELDLVALLLHERSDVCYVAGLENGYMTAYYAVLVPAEGEPHQITSSFEMLNSRLSSWLTGGHTFPVGADPIVATCQVVQEHGFARGRIGVQLNALTAAQYRSLQEQLAEAELVAADDLLPKIKAIKSPAEIAYLRESARVSTLGVEAARAEAAVGKTENDLAAAALAAMVRGGSEFMCIDPFVTSGPRSGVPHSTFQRRTLACGDAILIEVGACYRRYTAPLMRTVALQPIQDNVHRAANACRDSLNALIDAMRPGAIARDVAAEATRAWTPLCQELIWHGIYAYSVGLGFPPDWNDAPLCITAETDFELVPGMCFHATTSLREPAQFGTALSETVLITPTGCEVLTGSERELWTV